MKSTFFADSTYKPKANMLIDKLVAAGAKEISGASFKYRKFQFPAYHDKYGALRAGKIYWVGKNGALRAGETLAKSVSLTHVADQAQSFIPLAQ